MANEIQDVQSYEIITDALMDLLNSFPLLDGEKISFCDISADYGISMFPTSGAVIVSQIHDILGHTTQNCQYPFTVLYRVGSLRENQKISAKDFLDKLGKWLEKQDLIVDNVDMSITEYPILDGNRKFTEIVRTSPCTLTNIESNGVEQWSIGITARYVNEF